MFKKRSQASSKSNLRKRVESDEKNAEAIDSNDAPTEDELRSTLADALEIRKYRKRQNGVGVDELIMGDPALRKTETKEEPVDPWKLKSGGLVDLKEIKGIGMSFGEESNKKGGFAAASNTMDTEKRMQEFIEKELEKRRTGIAESKSISDTNIADASPTDELFVIPDNLKAASKPVSEGNVTLSASMLTAIPEVDLGMSSKMKNIEETERAKRDMIQKKLTKSDTKMKDDLNKITGGNILATSRFWQGRPREHTHHHPSQTNSSSSQNKEALSQNIDEKSGAQGGRKFDKRTMATDGLVMDKFKKRTRR